MRHSTQDRKSFIKSKIFHPPPPPLFLSFASFMIPRFFQPLDTSTSSILPSPAFHHLSLSLFVAFHSMVTFFSLPFPFTPSLYFYPSLPALFHSLSIYSRPSVSLSLSLTLPPALSLNVFLCLCVTLPPPSLSLSLSHFISIALCSSLPLSLSPNLFLPLFISLSHPLSFICSLYVYLSLFLYLSLCRCMDDRFWHSWAPCSSAPLSHITRFSMRGKADRLVQKQAELLREK